VAACKSFYEPACLADVFRTSSAGESWTPTTLSGLPIEALAIAPQNPAAVYATAAQSSAPPTDGRVRLAGVVPHGVASRASPAAGLADARATGSVFTLMPVDLRARTLRIACPNR
jgi:hypothetical protein